MMMIVPNKPKDEGRPLLRRMPQRSLLENFLLLAQMTTPWRHEAYCWPFLPRGDDETVFTRVDAYSNYHVTVALPGKKNSKSRIMWSCHLDTAGNSAPKHVLFRRTRDGAICTDGSTVLGADDKAGAAIMICMIQRGIPGHYVFHSGEEVGRHGSKAYAVIMEKMDESWRPEMCVALDRAGTADIITHQCNTRCCSAAWTKRLSELVNKYGLKYQGCPRGSFTDSYSYRRAIKECTNLSVGYYGQHTTSEKWFPDHAERLLDALCEAAPDIEQMPVFRDLKVEDKEDGGKWWRDRLKDKQKEYDEKLSEYDRWVEENKRKNRAKAKAIVHVKQEPEPASPATRHSKGASEETTSDPTGDSASAPNARSSSAHTARGNGDGQVRRSRAAGEFTVQEKQELLQTYVRHCLPDVVMSVLLQCPSCGIISVPKAGMDLEDLVNLACHKCGEAMDGKVTPLWEVAAWGMQAWEEKTKHPTSNGDD